MPCHAPNGTKSGTVHWLAQNFPGGTVAIERAEWHEGTEVGAASWTRWLDSRPTGDFADLCPAIYIGPADADSTKATIIVPCCNIIRGGQGGAS